MIFLTGDLHGENDLPKLDDFYMGAGKDLTRDDYVIILGDFGMIFDADTKYGYPWEENRIIEYFEEKYPWTTLFLDGNHENFVHLKKFPRGKWHGGQVSYLSEHCRWLHRGQVYTIEEKTFLTIGGAYSIDKAWRQPGISWWPDEAITEDDIRIAELNLAAHKYKVDYVLTHCAPYPIFFEIALQEQFQITTGDGTKNELLLQQINEKTTFKKWYFGHYHINRSYGKYECLYNDIIKL